MTDVPSIVSHLYLGTADFDAAVAVYDKVLPTVGAKRIMNHPGAAAFGKQFPEFWIQTPIDGDAASAGNGTHIAFIAASKEEVHAFWDAALAAGATPAGEPGPRPAYGDAYYACYVRDLDGHKIEATFYAVE